MSFKVRSALVVLMAVCLLSVFQQQSFANDTEHTSQLDQGVPNPEGNEVRIFLPLIQSSDSPSPQLLYDDNSPPEFVVRDGWNRNRITYAFQNGTTDMANESERQAIRDAFTIWTTANDFNFIEVAKTENPDIVIRWATSEHGDGGVFDGPGGTLAHATYPSRGAFIHFDDDETWMSNQTTNSSQPIDLVTVALHEIGHALGLGHSTEPNAIMFAFYGGSRRSLHNDDVQGIGYLYPSPRPRLAADVTSGQMPLLVHFTDQSANSPTAWQWNFGDGTTSNEKNPIHTYANPGAYDVTLTVSNQFGSQSMTEPAYIRVQAPPAPIAAFESSAKDGTAPVSISFYDRSTNNPTGWLWDFGDGTTSNEQNPVHTYAMYGSYDVTLTASNAYGSHSRPMPAYITVRPADRMVRMTGSLDIHDDDWPDSDEHMTMNPDESFPLSLENPMARYDPRPCVDDEVRLELSTQILLTGPNGEVNISGNVKYFEGTACDTNDLHKSQDFNFIVPPGESRPLDIELGDGAGYVKVHLNFVNN